MLYVQELIHGENLPPASAVSLPAGTAYCSRTRGATGATARTSTLRNCPCTWRRTSCHSGWRWVRHARTGNGTNPPCADHCYFSGLAPHEANTPESTSPRWCPHRRRRRGVRGGGKSRFRRRNGGWIHENAGSVLRTTASGRSFLDPAWSATGCKVRACIAISVRIAQPVIADVCGRCSDLTNFLLLPDARHEKKYALSFGSTYTDRWVFACITMKGEMMVISNRWQLGNRLQW